MSIGKRLIKIRGSQSQKDFAETLGTYASTLGGYERDQRLPDAGFIANLQEKYNINANWLITGIGPEKMGQPNTAMEDFHLDENRAYFAGACEIQKLSATDRGLLSDLAGILASPPNSAKDKLRKKIYDAYLEYGEEDIPIIIDGNPEEADKFSKQTGGKFVSSESPEKPVDANEQQKKETA